MPKGVRSYKKYVEAALLLKLTRDGDLFGITRWLPAPDRGFAPEERHGSAYNAEIGSAASPYRAGRIPSAAI